MVVVIATIVVIIVVVIVVVVGMMGARAEEGWLGRADNSSWRNKEGVVRIVVGVLYGARV